MSQWWKRLTLLKEVTKPQKVGWIQTLVCSCTLLTNPTVNVHFCSLRFGVYGSLSNVIEGKVRAVLTDMRMLLLLHHSALLDPKTGMYMTLLLLLF